jgi:hypothetical protein
MKKKTLDIRIAPGWIELPSESGRAYQMESAPAGILRITLQPPQWEEVPPKEMMEGQLLQLIHSLEIPLGELHRIACEDFTIGPAAICVYTIPKVGLVTFCLIAAEIMLFCTFEQTGGTLERYQEQMIEALAILERSVLE